MLTAVMGIIAFGTTVAQEVSLGVKAGGNLSSLSGDVEGMSFLPGFHAGGFAEIKLSEKFALQPELLFSMEGGKSSFKFQSSEVSMSSEEKLKLGYINLPVMAKYYVTEGLSVELGPQIGYLISAKSEYEFSSTFEGITIEDSGKEDVKDFMKKTSFGASVGLGYTMKNNLYFQARYHLGLSNINDTEDEEDGYLAKIKNNGFQLSVGFKF